MRPTVPLLKALIVFLMATSWLISHTVTATAQCPVTANFTATVSCTTPLQVQFTNTSTAQIGGTIVGYEWNFGDGNTSTATNPTHMYSSSGLYLVRLTVYDISGCSTDIVQPVQAYPPPVAVFTFNPNGECSNVPIQFNASASTGAGLTYTWDFGDGDVRTDIDAFIYHRFNARNNASCDNTATYTVTLTITDVNGCSSSTTGTVTVKRIPQPSLFDISGYNFSNCHNNPDPDHPEDTLTVANLTPNMACVTTMDIEWGDGAITTGILPGDFPLTHIYDSLGAFFLTVTAHGTNGCSADTTYVVANQANPNVGLSALGPNTGCAPFTMIMRLENYHMNTPGTTYIWDFGDGSPPITWNYGQPFINDTIEHTYFESHCDLGLDVYTVSVTAYNECEPAVMLYPNVRVYEVPEPDFEVDTTPCVGQNLHFHNLTHNGWGGDCNQTTFYRWDFGDGSPYSYLENPSHQYLVPGYYTVTLRAWNDRCGPADTSQILHVTGAHADFTNTIPCLGDTTFFFEESWAYDDSTWGPNPSISIVSWYWDFGDGSTSNLPNPWHIYSTADTFWVSLTVESEYGCDTTVIKPVWVNGLNITDIQAEDISCYGYNDGQITVTHTGGIDTVFYTLLPVNITNTTGVFTNLGPGPYWIYLHDTICDVPSDTVWINEPDAIEIDSIHIDHITCYGDENGEVRVFAHGGTNLIYTLYPDSTVRSNGNFDDLGAGSYYVVVTDENDCPPDSIHFTINEPPQLLIDSISVQHPSCHNDDGIITVYASGGIDTIPYTYILRWGGGPGNQITNNTGIFTGLSARTYWVTLRDANNCEVEVNGIELIAPPDIDLDALLVEGITCHNMNDGRITVIASGGTGPLTYTLFPGSISNTTGVFTNLGPGTYSIHIEDTVFCDLDIPDITIINPDEIEIDSINVDPIICHGDENGEIHVFAHGGTGLIYTLLPDSIVNSSGSFTNLGAGVYVIHVTDIYDCPPDFDTIELVDPPEMLIDSIQVQNVTCYGYEDGFIHVFASGGINSAGYTFTLSFGASQISNTTGFFDNLDFGIYSIIIEDDNGCDIDSTGIQITSPPELFIDSIYVQDISCYNYNDGRIVLQASGGTGTLSYVLTPGSIVNTTGVFDSLSANIYTVSIIDENNCSYDVPGLQIHNPEPITIDSVQVTHIACHGDINGSITIYGHGGTDLAYYLYADSIAGVPLANSSGLFENLPAGFYYALLEDINGCPSDTAGPIEIIEPPEILIDSIISSHTLCYGSSDGFIHVYASGGITPYSYELQPNSIINFTGFFDNLPAGVYTIEITDSNDCVIATPSIIINEYPEIEFELSHTDIPCYGYDNGSITIFNVTGGSGPNSYMYTINNGATWDSLGFFNGLSPGFYYVNVRDTNMCEAEGVVIEITEPTEIANSFTSVPPTCNGCTNGQITANPSGGTPPYTHYWSNGMTSNPITVGAGSYTDTIIDANGCVFIDNTILYEPDSLILQVDAHPIDCYGYATGWASAIVFGGTPPYTFEWRKVPNPTIIGVSDTIFNLDAGFYEIVIRDFYDNYLQDTVEVIEPESPVSITFNYSDTVCYGDTNGWASVYPTGGTAPYTFLWDGGNMINTDSIYNLGAGTYNVTVTDSAGCEITDGITIIENPRIFVDPIADPSVVCSGAPIQLTANSSGGTGLHLYYWTPDSLVNNPNSPNPIAYPAVTTTFIVSVTDERGCENTGQVIADIQPTPLAEFIYDNPCESNLVEFYDQSNSNGDTITEWQWDFGDGTFTSQQNPVHTYTILDTTYTVRLIVLNSNGCTDTITHDIYINPLIGLDIFADTVCVGDLTSFTFTIQDTTIIVDSCYWDFGDGNFSNNFYPTHTYLLPGNYNVSLTVVDIFGCLESANRTIKVDPLPVPDFLDSTSCVNNLTYFTDQSFHAGTSIVDWFWDFGDGDTSTLQNPVHLYPGAGAYTVSLTVTNNNGCTNTFTRDIMVILRPIADFIADTVCRGEEVYFQDLSYTTHGFINTWFWDFGDGGTSVLQNPVHTYSAAGLYNVMLIVSNDLGCYDTILHSLPVNELPEAIFTATTVCESHSTQLSDFSLPNAGSIVSWFWNFGDGYTSNQQNPSHIFPGAGTYNVTLRIENDNGCVDDTIVPVIVNELPEPDFNYDVPTCVNNPCQFYDLSIANSDSVIAWFWDFGDGFNSALQNPAHAYSSGGIFIVELIVTNSNGCSDTISKSLLIHPQPEANFDYDTACVGQTTYFYDLSSSPTGQIIDWYWDFDDPASGINNNSTQQNPAHLFSTAGIYNVMLIVTNTTLCEDTIIYPVVINDPPSANYSYSNMCVNDTAVFFDMTSLASAPIAAWIWDFGDGTSLSYGSYRDSVTHVFASSGSYIVTLTVVDSNRCIDHVNKIVVVEPLPAPLFDYTQICENNPTHFTDLSSGSGASITSWSWDFGDPASGASNYSTLQHPLHQFTTSGIYMVTLEVINGNGCTNTVTLPVEIVPGPVSAFTADSMCVGTPTNFLDLSYAINDSISQWFWDFGDGFNSTSQNPIHTYSASGVYYVTLTVVTSNGCMDNITIPFEVHELPVAYFEYKEPNCAGDSTYFMDLSYSMGSYIISSWTWDLGDGTTSDKQNPVHLYSAPGLYNVILSVYDTNGCSNDYYRAVWVNPRPVAEYTKVITNCDSVQFTDQSFNVNDSIVAWAWDFGDPASGWANFSNLQNPMHVFFGADTFNVQLIVTDSHGCLDTVDHLVTLNKPVADFVWDTACVNGGTQFIDLSYAAGSTIAGWHWDFDDGTTSTATSPTHYFTAPGWFNVVLTVTSADGCVSQIMKPCYVHPLPMPDFYADTACAFNETHFTDMSLPLGGITSWYWDFGEPVSGMSNFSNLPNPIHSYLSSGVFNVTLVVQDINGCEHYIVKPIFVSPEPNVNFTFADNQCAEEPVYFNDLSSTPSGYIEKWIWNWGDSSPNDTIHYPNPPSTVHTYQNGGNFLVTLRVITSNDCEAVLMKNISIIQNPLADFYHENACEDVYINFYDQSSTNGGGPIIGWNWDFGDPASGPSNNSYVQDPAHIFSAPGTYTVTQIITNSHYCTDTITREINIYENPGVDFTSNPACHMSPTQFFVNLSVTNIATITSYDWDFGDGTTSTLMNPVHTYNNAGIYDVNLMVSDTNGCDNTAYNQIEVYELPVANFEVYGDMCASDDVYFQDFSIANHGVIEYWIWDFDDGTPPQMIQFPQNPNIYHHFNQPGIYGVTLTVFSTDSCMHSYTRNVDIYEEPTADFNNSASCTGNPVQFTDISLPGSSSTLTNWYWDFGDPGSGLANTSSSQNPEHIYDYGDSTYYVLLIVENTNNCYDTIVKPVYVYDGPPVEFAYDANCEDTLTQFYPDSSVVNISSIATWEWDFGDGTTAYVSHPTHIYPSAGTYTVTLTVSDVNGCENTISHNVTITPLPVALFSAPSHSCMGAPVFFNDNSTTTSGYIASYYWNFGDGTDTTINFPGNPDISHMYAGSGAYQVTLVVTTSDNCQNHIEQTVNIDLAPVAAFDTEGECSVMPVQFYDLSQQSGSGYVVSWNWDFGDPSTGINNQSIAQNPEHLFSAAGNYNVTLIVHNDAGCADTIVQNVEVSPPAPVDYTHDGHCHLSTTYFYIDETITDIGAITSYTWDFGDGTPGSSVMNPEHIYNMIGYYDVTLTVTDTNGCSNQVMHQVEITAIPSANFSYEFTCVEDITSFYDNSTINGEPITSWYWDFGDPASGAANNSTLQDPDHDYTVAGNYTVKLIVSSESGCQDSLEMALDIIPSPEADFAYEVNPCETGLVYFTDSSFANFGEITSWFWTFEPGHYSNEQNPIYVFSQTNTTYTITLVVEDESGCTGTIEQDVYVPLGMQIEVSNSAACHMEAIEFDAYISSPANDSIVSYLWTFGDPMNPNAQSSSANPSYTYPIPGTFTVSLEATDQFGCTETTYKQVVVDNLPVPDFQFEAELCDSNFYFTDLSSGSGASIVTWTWDFGDGSAPVTINAPNTPDIVHLYSELGTYNASLIVTNANGCKDTIEKEVTRDPCVIGNFTLSDTLCCQGNMVTFLDSSTMHDYIYLYEWDFDDGTDTVYTEEAHAILHRFYEARNYKVRLVIHANVNDVEFKDTSLKIVRVKTKPVPDFVCPDACLGDWSFFTDKSETPMGYIKSWFWEFGDDWQSSTSTEEDPAYQYHETGEYVVQLTVRNTYGCIDSIKHMVNVNDSPEADFSYESVCLGDPVHFWDESDPVQGNIKYWRWDFGDTLAQDDTAKIKNPYYTYDRLGDNTVELVVANEFGCIDKIQKDVEVHPNPLSLFDIVPNYQGQQGDVLAQDEALGADGWEWNWGDGNTTWGNAPPLMHTYERDGEYTIQQIVWNEYGCSDTSYHDYEFMFKALYVPNAFAPTGNNDKVKLFLPKGRGLDSYICEVFDTWGNRLWSSELVDTEGRPVEGWDGTFRNKQLPTDVYIWRIKAVFRDGTVWNGESVGNTDDLPEVQQGTVTLIR